MDEQKQLEAGTERGEQRRVRDKVLGLGLMKFDFSDVGCYNVVRGSMTVLLCDFATVANVQARDKWVGCQKQSSPTFSHCNLNKTSQNMFKFVEHPAKSRNIDVPTHPIAPSCSNFPIRTIFNLENSMSPHSHYSISHQRNHRARHECSHKAKEWEKALFINLNWCLIINHAHAQLTMAS